jgi:hypothetical protein
MWAASFVLSLAQWYHVVLLFGNDSLKMIFQAEQGVLDGYPHWRLVQSRVLGPWLEKFLNLLFGFNLSLAHAIIAIAMLTLCGVVMFYAGSAIGGRPRGWSALVAFYLLCTLMMARPWLYIWDYFVLLAAAIFMLLVIRHAPWWLFLLLMSVAFFNHDSALFIGVWMVAKALTDVWVERRRPNWGMLGGGVLGSLGGILLIEYLRRSLLKGETGWGPIETPPPTTLEPYYFFLRLTDNFLWMMHPRLDGPGYERPLESNLLFLIPLPLVLALVFAVILVVRHGMKAAPLTIYALTQVAALLLFAIIQETRAFLQLVPFLCLGGMLATKPDLDTLHNHCREACLGDSSLDRDMKPLNS